jgi:hypothetical protein
MPMKKNERQNKNLTILNSLFFDFSENYFLVVTLGPLDPIDYFFNFPKNELVQGCCFWIQLDPIGSKKPLDPWTD